MFNLFDSNKDGVLDFGEFVQSLNIFHPDTPQAQKADCMYVCVHIKHIYICLQYTQFHTTMVHAVAFQLYDIWQTGFIERGEVSSATCSHSSPPPP